MMHANGLHLLHVLKHKGAMCQQIHQDRVAAAAAAAAASAAQHQLLCQALASRAAAVNNHQGLHLLQEHTSHHIITAQQQV
jgi:lactam utilization protein B